MIQHSWVNTNRWWPTFKSQKQKMFPEYQEELRCEYCFQIQVMGPSLLKASVKSMHPNASFADDGQDMSRDGSWRWRAVPASPCDEATARSIMES